jgi:hypothetical protein
VFSWEIVSQSRTDNSTTIKWSVVAAGGKNSAYWTYVQEKYVTVNGVTQTNTTKVTTYNGTVAFSGQTVIKHSNNGKGSFSASCGGAFYEYGKYNSTGSGSWDLPTIKRLTTPVLSGTFELGKTVTISLEPIDSTYKHKLTYSIGSLSEQTSGLTSGANFTAQGDVTVDFTPPMSLGEQFPNYDGTICTIECYTYDKNGKLIGQTSQGYMLSVPEYTLTLSVEITGNNLLNGAYVQNRSSANVNITASTSYGATIRYYSTTIDGKTYTSQNFTTAVLSSETKTVKVTVQDSRGRYVSIYPTSITVYEYKIPYITSFSLARQSDGTTVVASLKGGFAAVNNKNAKTVEVTLNGVTNTVTTSAYTFDTTTTFSNVPTDSTLTGKLALSDSYCYGDTAITKEAVLPTVAVTMDFYKDGNGIAMGKVAENGNLLDVAWNERVRGNLDVEGNINGINIHTGNYIFGGSREGITDENWIANVPSFIGTYSQNDQWYSTISLRHRNGWEDGTNYGLQLRSILTQEDNLSWRQNMNGSWKNWKTILDSNNTADYVVAQGTSGIWTYRKWNSGVAECWGSYSGNIAITKTWGSIYYSDSLTPRINYPFTFISRPIENVTFRGSSIAGWMYSEAGGFSLNTTTQTAQYGVCRPTSISAAELKFDFYIIGKWK